MRKIDRYNINPEEYRAYRMTMLELLGQSQAQVLEAMCFFDPPAKVKKKLERVYELLDDVLGFLVYSAADPLELAGAQKILAEISYVLHVIFDKYGGYEPSVTLPELSGSYAKEVYLRGYSAKDCKGGGLWLPKPRFKSPQ